MVLGVRCDVDIFKLTARAQSINSESLYEQYFVKVFSGQFYKYNNFLSWPLVISIII